MRRRFFFSFWEPSARLAYTFVACAFRDKLLMLHPHAHSIITCPVAHRRTGLMRPAESHSLGAG